MCDYGVFCNIFAHSLFGNLLMIDFQLRNERLWRILQYFRSFLIWKSINDRFPNKECAIQQRRTRFFIGKQQFSWRSPPCSSFLIVKRVFLHFLIVKSTNDWFPNKKWAIDAYFSHFLIVKRAFDAFYNKDMTGIKLVRRIATWGCRARRPARTVGPP